MTRAVELLRGTSPERECSYLPSETARTEYRFLLDVSADEYAAMLARGWRRQGVSFFRPVCRACVKCRPLRVDVRDFAPTKSQRRCLRRNADVTLTVRRPQVSGEHLALYDAYHADMHARRGWDADTTDAESYVRSLIGPGYPFAREFAYHRGDALVGVGLVDAVPGALNSIYFYHDPDWRPDGPGTFSALKEIEYARETGRDWVYLGFWIPENASMSYKNRFAPHEILAGRPGVNEDPEWSRP